MSTTIDATFDGEVFRPIGPVSLPADTNVRLTVETIPEQPRSFFEVAQSLNLEGPPDWATNFDSYLYGNRGRDAE